MALKHGTTVLSQASVSAPQDYHRYHSPVTGTISWFRMIPGDYYQVDPVCLQSDADILTQKARCCLCIDSEEFGRVLFVAIGATNVGTVEIHERIRNGNVSVQKGEEMGLFQFGGSKHHCSVRAGKGSSLMKICRVSAGDR